MTEPGAERATWSTLAPAKVNLRLRVGAKRPDGYHAVETVLQALALADRVAVSLRGDQRVVLELTGVPPGSLGPDAANLAVRAAELFRSALDGAGQRAPGATIRLEKVIPHGAGLGGGSSDAAAVLRAMNELTGRPLSVRALRDLAAGLGSDVPFFTLEASRALAWGRGERVLPLAPLPERSVLLAVPAEPISTAWAYAALAAHRSADAQGQGRDTGGNDFEAALFPLRPELRQIKGVLEGSGAEPALLSGSGSALFGLFGSDASLDRAERDLSRRGEDLGRLRVFRTRTLTGFPTEADRATSV